MLAISQGAFRSLQAAQEQRFATDVIRVLWEELPRQAQAAGPESLLALVQRTLGRAKKWGIEDSEAIGQLCALALGLGEELLDDAAVSAFLSSDEVGQQEKVARLLEAIDD